MTGPARAFGVGWVYVSDGREGRRSMTMSVSSAPRAQAAGRLIGVLAAVLDEVIEDGHMGLLHR